MTDIFQEVEEDIRRERLRRLWDRFGIYLIIGAVLIVVLTAGWRGWVAWQTSRSEAAGDAFQAAIEEARDSTGSGGAEQLAAIASDGPSGYALLARFRLASEHADNGDTTAAIEGFQAIAADRSVGELYRDLARIRAGYVFLDAGDPGAAAAEVAILAERQTGAFTYTAREVMGLSAYADGNYREARRWFADLEGDAAVPQTLRGRAQLMLTLLEGRIAPEPAADEAASAPPEETTSEAIR